MRKENFLLVVLSLTVLLVVFYPSSGWKLRSLLAPAMEENADLKKMALENESLRAELAKLAHLAKADSYAGNFLEASVYSSYPFNFKSELLLNKGEKDGVRQGQPVFIPVSGPGRVLVGRIKEVFRSDSLAETIFDSRFQISVRIGAAGVNSLLKGGSSPVLTLIPKDSKIDEGDVVYSTGQGYPFGSAVGSAKNLRISSDRFFEEADLETMYNVNDLQVVVIDTGYDVKNYKQ